MNIYHENSLREEMALVDKVILYNIQIDHIEDVDRLRDIGVLEGSDLDRYCYRCKSGIMFKRLIISEDPMIDRLCAANSNFGNYCTIQLSIHNGEGTNLHCWTVEEYKQYLEKIWDHLQRVYGIIISNIDEVKIKSIEINRTFCLNGNFADYHRVFNLIMHKLKYPMKLNAEWSVKTKGNIVPGTYISKSTSSNKNKNNYQQFKIYNKSRDIQTIIEVNRDIMRAEITLIGDKRIRKSLSTNYFFELTDDMINDFYSKWIHDFIVNPLDKWKRERDIELLRILWSERAADQRRWKVNVLRRIEDWEITHQYPLALDIEDVLPLLKKLDIKNLKRVRRTFREQAQKYETALTNGDNEKLLEIIGKMTAKYSEDSNQEELIKWAI